ncbi:hypothetical protein EDD86DRAFT_252330 [Gorgonomyces haynaldii]|nr:hypothetical protein EDD86DRAFT_252330 [Gorgonomyces haynaldii]
MVFNFEPTNDLNGKIAIVTGGSSGIGKVTCYKLAKLGCHVIIMARNEAKTLPIIQDIVATTGNDKVEFVELKLDDLENVKQAGHKILAKNIKIDILINNAGLANPNTLTKDGYQTVFQVNHLGPFLLTEILLPAIQDGGRIVNVSSKASFNGAPYDFEALKINGTESINLKAYGDSKLANVMHAKKLAQLLTDRNISTYSLHPGVVATDVWRGVPSLIQPVIKFFMLTEEQGAMTTLYCALADIKHETGLYYDDCKVKNPNPVALDQKEVDRLYDTSKQLVQAFL